MPWYYFCHNSHRCKKTDREPCDTVSNKKIYENKFDFQFEFSVSESFKIFKIEYWIHTNTSMSDWGMRIWLVLFHNTHVVKENTIFFSSTLTFFILTSFSKTKGIKAKDHIVTVMITRSIWHFSQKWLKDTVRHP